LLSLILREERKDDGNDREKREKRIEKRRQRLLKTNDKNECRDTLYARLNLENKDENGKSKINDALCGENGFPIGIFGNDGVVINNKVLKNDIKWILRLRAQCPSIFVCWLCKRAISCGRRQRRASLGKRVSNPHPTKFLGFCCCMGK
jgi:hypothetical protein